jgi:hypothetical protein
MKPWNLAGSFIFTIGVSMRFVFAICSTTYSKSLRGDVVKMKNGDQFTGEVKGLQNGILSIDTEYSSDALSVDWTKVQEIKSTATYLITFANGVHVKPSRISLRGRRSTSLGGPEISALRERPAGLGRDREGSGDARNSENFEQVPELAVQSCFPEILRAVLYFSSGCVNRPLGGSHVACCRLSRGCRATRVLPIPLCKVACRSITSVQTAYSPMAASVLLIGERSYPSGDEP